MGLAASQIELHEFKMCWQLSPFLKGDIPLLQLDCLLGKDS